MQRVAVFLMAVCVGFLVACATARSANEMSPKQPPAIDMAACLGMLEPELCAAIEAGKRKEGARGAEKPPLPATMGSVGTR
jgi:hypothetical protein